MNDIQQKENICVAAKAAVESRVVNLNAAKRHVKRLKSQYLQAVVDAAAAHEKLQRKKSATATAILWTSYVLLTLIVLGIHLTAGILFFVLVGVVAWMWQSNVKEEKAKGYDIRASFFSRYAEAVREDEQLKWKNRDITYSGPIAIGLDEGEWSCAFCGSINGNSDLFCTECGVRKSVSG